MHFQKMRDPRINAKQHQSGWDQNYLLKLLATQNPNAIALFVQPLGPLKAQARFIIEKNFIGRLIKTRSKNGIKNRTHRGVEI